LKKSHFIYIKLTLALASTLLFIVYYFQVFSTKYTNQINDFQKEFSQLEIERDVFLENNTSSLNDTTNKSIWLKTIKKKNQNLHVYKSDSLVYWSTNQMPILRFSDIHFPSEGIIHLQNGWYYGKIERSGDYILCASFLVKKDYSYENNELKNEFTDKLQLPFTTYITFEQENGYPIYSKEKKYLFSIHPNEYQTADANESIWLMLSLMLSIILWLYFITDFNKVVFKKNDWILPLTLLFIRIISTKYVWFGFMHVTDAFNPSLYGTNEWFPNFFEYLLNVVVLAYLSFYLAFKLKNLVHTKLNKPLGILLLLLLFGYWFFISQLNQSLVENSSITLAIDKLFSLNVYSVMAIASVGLLFFSFYQLSAAYIVWQHNIQLSYRIRLGIVLLSGLSFAFIMQFNFSHPIINDLLPLILLIILVSFKQFKKEISNPFFFGLSILFLFSVVEAIDLVNYNSAKEKSDRVLYANQLATEKDVLTEVEYASLIPEIKADNFLNKLINSPRNMGLSDFEDALERRLFNGYWERYEMSFNLFDENQVSIVSPNVGKVNPYQELTQIIENQGSKSEIDSTIFFVKDFTGHYSYIIQLPLYTEDSTKMELVCTLKSKKIPEEIGFPRLLISNKAKVIEPLKNYSIAKYFHSHLVTKYGVFNYPTSYVALNNWSEVETGFYDMDGYNHYLLKKSDDDVFVLSAKNYTYIEFITSFSYLFTYYGFLLIPLLIQRRKVTNIPKGFSLAFKIQLVLISLVFLSLLAFGWGSGLFVNKQYNDYKDGLIREKLNSIEIQLKEKLGKNKTLTIEEEGNYIELQLQKFAKVFVTDINLYDRNGFLLAASRPKVFNVGLLSEQMNATAFYELEIKDKSEFIHQESIGDLMYSSAYSPFYNNQGKLLGYLNLQHFGQQKEFENKIQQFLVAIINVFILLLAISIIIAIVVSNWVTTPLRIIQESFSKLKFGKHNQPIQYTKQDEIGALVKNYNEKLEELEYTAQQLAQSERESAWREMAKQVAHEIKNPLTPMKLSVQHLLRIYDPNDPDSGKKLEKVSYSIIEQIDALAKIANEFSSFAKLPRPNEEQIDLLPIIKGVIEVFKDENRFQLALHSVLDEVIVMADKDLMMRIFNNLIKNAIQAITDKANGVIVVNVKQHNSVFLIEVADNGIGISADVQSKIFVPYFTTKTTGTGLGLAMVKQIIENHRGTIDFTSDENGTTFSIELPCVK
jgi:two-component system, NtrC family, nitrogen regulation sensor histidine kinase NtrY